MQTRKPLFLLAVGTALVACTPAPEDPLFAFGSLQAPDGTPTAGTITFLRAECHGWCGPTSGVPAPEEPAPEDPAEPPPEWPLYLPFTELATEADGSWMLELTRFDATEYSQLGTESRLFKAVAQPDPALPPVEAEYSYGSNDVDLPPLRQWDAQASVALTPTGEAWQVRSAPALPIPRQDLAIPEEFPIDTRRSGRYGIAFLDANDAEVWFHPATGVPTDLPLEVLEDFAVAWQPIATHQGPWFAPSLLGGQTYSTVVQRFPVQELPAHSPRIALSRGQTCSLFGQQSPDPQDLHPIEELTPCPVTDGKLEPVRFDQYPAAVQITLETPAVLTRVILHRVQANLEGLRIEAFDGTAWHLVADVHGDLPEDPDTPSWAVHSYERVADLPAGLGPIQAVRVLSLGGAIMSAQEISLF